MLTCSSVGMPQNMGLNFKFRYYQIRYYLKSGSSLSPVTSYGKFMVAFQPPSLINDVTIPDELSPSVKPAQTIQPVTPAKGCTSTVLIMYHKESTSFHNTFEQVVQVNVDYTQLEDIFKQSELNLCLELWFAEDSEK